MVQDILNLKRTPWLQCRWWRAPFGPRILENRPKAKVPSLKTRQQKCGKSSINQLRIVRARSNLVQSLTKRYPMYVITTNVQGQVATVKVTAWKRRMIAKLLLSFLISRSLNLVAMSEFLIGTWEISVCAHTRYKIKKLSYWPKQLWTTGATSGCLRLQWISNFHIF